MYKAPNLHSNFFSSLKQVEKRLKLDTPSPPPQRPPSTFTESLSSPIFLNFDQRQNPNPSSTLQSSETPHEFFSNLDDFSPTHETPPPKSPQITVKTLDSFQIDDVDEIGLLISLLGLSDCEDDDEQNLGFKGCVSCGCGGGFYDKIVGVKGPKCEKEVERLCGWIRHFREEKIEPLRMAHLLLGKAAFVSGNGSELLGLEFPSTVEEFLQNDCTIR